MASRVGASVALHSSAVGKAYLAALDETARERLLSGLPLPARMPGTVASLPALRAQLAETVARGYATDNEENEAGIVCYGVALCDAAGRPVAGVSVSTLLFRRHADPQAAYIAPLLRLRDAAAAKLALLPVSPGGA
ncbi:Pectin degradation repressor protein KdgR [compost metagenome]